MKRKIITIDEDKCIGCGLCVSACNEGAIGMVDGKAKLLREDYCDGLGNCLPACPVDAISFEEREAKAFDKAAVKAAQGEKTPPAGGCPGMNVKTIGRDAAAKAEGLFAPIESELSQWPVQIKLVPENAPYFDGADLLVAADCTAFSFGDFHKKFIKNHITLIGCPKLDEGDYSEKLGRILSGNNINSLHVVRMEVPCCGGIEHAAREALRSSGKNIPFYVTTITTDGKIKY